jgi:hypothetical protein
VYLRLSKGGFEADITWADFVLVFNAKRVLRKNNNAQGQRKSGIITVKANLFGQHPHFTSILEDHPPVFCVWSEGDQEYTLSRSILFFKVFENGFLHPSPFQKTIKICKRERERERKYQCR